MKSRSVVAAGCLAVMVLTGRCNGASAAGKQVEAPLTEQGEALQAKYAERLRALKAEIAAAVPAVDEGKRTAFLAAHAAVEAVPPQPNPNRLKNGPPRYAPSHRLYAVAQSNAWAAAEAILPDVDAFLASDRLDAQLATCALLAHATPRGLAEFAQQGAEQEALIEALIRDEALIRQIMACGGAYEGKYGEALRNYKAIQKASARSRDGFFQRWALASSLEHADRKPPDEGLTAAELGVAPEDLGESPAGKGRTPADVLAELYLNYEQAYLDGKLDPAFDRLSDFDYRFVLSEYSADDVTWMREMLRNYRPDHIVNPDYTWRYCRIVRTDVPYTGGLSGRRPLRPDLHLSKFQDFFLEGGICGPRAFVGKLSTSAFGIPTRGARQTGHAAMSHWTPNGWTTVFGAHWTFNSWRGRCGLDFFLESQARREPEAYLKVLRAEWVGDALGEAKVNPMQYGIGGGLWHALAFYKKLAIVEAARIVALGPTGEELSESNVEAVTNAVAGIEMTEADRTIVFGADGVITIPAGACTSPENTEKIRFMRTIEGDGIQVHYGLGGGRPELLKYTVEAPAAGKYEFTMRVCTVTVDRKLLLRLNRRTLVDIPLPYTRGFWDDTEGLVIDLAQGRNTLMVTAETPNKGVSIRHIKLRPVK